MATDASGSTESTKDAGWEVGVRKTVAAPLPVVWEFLLSEGLVLWLGDTTLVREKGAGYLTADGVRGTVRSVTEENRMRLTWRPDDWPHDTTLQLRVKEAPGGTTIALHHERLAGRDERHMMLGHWKNVIAVIADTIDRR